MSRIVMSIEENGIGQVLGEFDLSEHYHRIYNKAIDDFVTRCKCMNIDLYNYPSSCIQSVAEQLKGDKNDKSI